VGSLHAMNSAYSGRGCLRRGDGIASSGEVNHQQF
jgi:hypothetical protein